MKVSKKAIVTFVAITALSFAFVSKSFGNMGESGEMTCQIGSNYLNKYKNRTIGIAYGGDLMQVQADVAPGSCWAYVTVVESKNNKDIIGKKILINVSNIGFMF
ncbi:MAG: hypothetical protein PHI97_12510 [Desulfobulbus sp.]|nr:hypothetical protein [Desulfobulbus sp.]